LGVGVGVMGTENLRAAMNQPGVKVGAVCDVYQPHLERAGMLARCQVQPAGRSRSIPPGCHQPASAFVKTNFSIRQPPRFNRP